MARGSRDVSRILCVRVLRPSSWLRPHGSRACQCCHGPLAAMIPPPPHAACRMARPEKGCDPPDTALLLQAPGEGGWRAVPSRRTALAFTWSTKHLPFPSTPPSPDTALLLQAPGGEGQLLHCQGVQVEIHGTWRERAASPARHPGHTPAVHALLLRNWNHTAAPCSWLRLAPGVGICQQDANTRIPEL
jgi:hypothetical protein